MTSTTNNTPLSHYFATCNEPLLGGDPFLLLVDDAWDADLHPDEYGDQSGVVRHSWEDDNASFTDDSDSDFSDADADNDADDDQSDNDSHDNKHHHHRRRHRQEEWSLVYTASITVVTTTTAAIREEEEKSDQDFRKTPTAPSTTTTSNKDRSRPRNLLLNPQMHRRDSKVRFCEEPPTVVSYEHCSREEYSQLYYSVHELQKIIDEVRLENTPLVPPPTALFVKKSGPSSVAAASSSLAANNRKAADNNHGNDNDRPNTPVDLMMNS